MEMTLKRLIAIIVGVLILVIFSFFMLKIEDKNSSFLDFTEDKTGQKAPFLIPPIFLRPLSKHLNNRIIIINKLLDRGGMNEQ